jgi:hypothetical protein
MQITPIEALKNQGLPSHGRVVHLISSEERGAQRSRIGECIFSII